MKMRPSACVESLMPRCLLSAVPLEGIASIGSGVFPVGDAVAVARYTTPNTIQMFGPNGKLLSTNAWPFPTDIGNSVTYCGALRGRALVFVGTSLWLTGGTVDTTRKLWTFNNSYRAPVFARFGSQFAVAVENELVITGGLTSNTRKIVSHSQGKYWERISAIEPVDNTFRFNAVVSEEDPYQYERYNFYNQLWKSDGTVAGTEFMEETGAGSRDFFDTPAGLPRLSSSNEGTYFVSGENLYFDAGRKKDRRLISADVASPFFAVLGSGVVLFCEYEGRPALAYADSSGVTIHNTVIPPDERIEAFEKVGNRALFVTKHGLHQTLWSTDGSERGTYQLSLIDADSDQDRRYEVASTGDHAHIRVKVEGKKAQLFRTDGLVNETTSVEPWLVPEDIARAGSTVFVSGQVSDASDRLSYWLSDVRQVVGQVTYDSPGDAPVATLRGVTVWLDLDGDGKRDSSEPNQTTSSDGFFQFSDVPAIARVAVDTMNGVYGFRGSNARTVEVDSGSAQRVDFVVIDDNRPSAANGTVRAYSSDPSGPYGVNYATPAGLRVFADLNSNAKFDRGEPTAFTNSKGRFFLSEVPADTRADIRVSLGSSYVLEGKPQSVQFVPGQDHDAKTITMLPVATVRGTVYEDANANGKRDKGEPGIAGLRLGVMSVRDLGRKVYTDANGAFVADVYAFATRPTVSPYDSIGSGLRVTQQASPVVVAGSTAETMLGLTRLSEIRIDFKDDDDGKSRTVNDRSSMSEPPVSSAWIDLNLNGVKDAGEESSRSGSAIVFGRLRKGQQFKIHIDIAAGYYDLFASRLPTEMTTGGWISTASVVVSRFQTLTGRVFHENEHNPRRGAGQKPLVGTRVFIDYNDNGKRDAEDVWAFTDASGNYSISNVRLGDRRLLASLPSGLRVQPHELTAKVRSGRANVLDVNVTSRGRISGFIYVDNNGNGQSDPGEGDYVDNLNWTVDLLQLVARDAEHPEGYDYIGINYYTEPRNFFQFERVPAGTHVLTLEYQPGFDPAKVREVAVTVLPGAETELLIRVPAGWIR